MLNTPFLYIATYICCMCICMYICDQVCKKMHMQSSYIQVFDFVLVMKSTRRDRKIRSVVEPPFLP